MLSLEPQPLCEEIDKAEEFRRRHTSYIAQIAQRYTGNWYRTDMSARSTPENSIFSYIAYMMPEVWASSPTCRVRAKRPITQQTAGQAMEEGLNAWIAESNLMADGTEAVRDAFLGFGFLQIGVEGRDQYDGANPSDVAGGGELDAHALMPFVARLGCDQLILDPACDSVRTARYIGHTYWMDLEDLQADPDMWPPEAVVQLTEGSGEDEGGPTDERPLNYGQTPNRKRVQLVDLWVREHGMLITMSRTTSGVKPVILRQVKYWGPPDGPYVIIGFYNAVGDPYPLSPLSPVMEQLEEMWSHQSQASLEAETYKKFAVVESSASDWVKAVQESVSGGLYTVAGLTGKFLEIELGGAPPGRLDHIMALRDRSDRTLGISDQQRGRVKNSTATEADVVQKNVDTRTNYMRARVRAALCEVLRKVGWYLFNDAAVVMPISQVDPRTGQMRQGTFLGGPQQGQEGYSWLDFNLDIEPQSMLESDDQVVQQRTLELMQVVEQIIQFRAIAPDVNFRYIVNMFGESFNQKDLYELLFDPAVQAQMQQAAMQQAMGVPPAAGVTSGQPAGGGGGFGGGGGGMGGGGNPLAQGQAPAGLAGPGGPPSAPMPGAGGSMQGGPRAGGGQLPFLTIGRGGKQTSGGPRQAGKPSMPRPSAGGLSGGPRQSAGHKPIQHKAAQYTGGPRHSAGQKHTEQKSAQFTGGPRAKKVTA